MDVSSLYIQVAIVLLVFIIFYFNYLDINKQEDVNRKIFSLISLEIRLLLVTIIMFIIGIYMNLHKVFFVLKIIYILFIIYILYKIYKTYINRPIEEKVQEQTANDEEEEKMVKGISSLQETTASEILTPRTSLYTIDADTTLLENWQEILNQEFSRIPVYLESIDNIIGVLFLKDILRIENKNIQVKKLIRKPYFIPGTKKIIDILKNFKQTQNHMAIVIDEYGGTEGVVTIEDILEEIVGEIRDEYDIEEDKIINVQHNIYEISGDHLIEDINEELKISIPISEEYDTLSGYFLYKLGKIAQKNDTIKTDEYIMRVLKTDNIKIEKIKLILLEADDDKKR